MYASTHFSVESIRPVPRTFGDFDVRVSSTDYRQVAGRTACADRHRRRIVRVSTQTVARYGILKESSLIPLGACWLGERLKPKAPALILVRITPVPTWLAWLIAQALLRRIFLCSQKYPTP